MTKLRLLGTVAASAVAICAMSPASAQDAAAPQTSSDAQAAEGAAQADGAADPTRDVIVTAQGRNQLLSDVPLAVSAVSQESLELSGATDIRQLNQVAPSLLVSSTGSDANTSARVRGVGTVGDNPGLESSVAVFIDGVYRSRTGISLNDLGEIDRIEVLRGPQGTLFGRNASAGLLNIVSRRPEFDFHASGEFTYGNYDFYRAQVGVTGPVSEQLALRFDGVYSKRDGFYRDVNSGYDVNNRDRFFVKGQALFEPSSALSVRLIADYSEKKEACCAAVYANSDIAPTNANLISTANPIIPVLTSVSGATFAQYFPSINDPYDRRIAISPGRSYDGKTKDWGVSGQIDWDLGGAKLTSITAYRQFDAYQAADADYGYADLLNFLPGSGREFRTFSQELRLQGQAFDNKLDWLIGGYYAHEKLETHQQLAFGSQYGPFAACRLIATISTALPRDPSQAGCLAGPNGAITAGALAGIFPDPPGATVGAQPFIDALRLLTQVRNVGDDTANFYQTSKNFAFFTHNIFHVTDKLDVTIGLRYTNETKDLTADFRNTNTICPQIQAIVLPYLSGAAATTVPSTLTGGVASLGCQGNSSSALNALTLDDQRKEDRFTGTGVVSYKPTDDLLVYASYSRGYKAGGFNLDRSAFTNPTAGGPLPIFPLNPAFIPTYEASLQFDEETVNAYEIGMKYSTRAFTFGMAAFRQEFRNFQLNTFDGAVYIVQNINGCSDNLNGADRDTNNATGSCSPDNITPGLVSRGIELEASLSPAKYVRFNAAATFADTRYADNLVGRDTGTPLNQQLRLLPGDNLSNAPQWVVTSSLAWTPPIGGSGLSGLFYVDARVSDDYNTGSDLFPQKEQDSFVVMNGRIGIRGRDERWGLELWAQNLLNTQYSQVVFSSPYQAGGPAAAIGPLYPAARYPAANQIFSAYLSEPRTYGVTLRGRF